jgi:hypothetical protein
MTTETKAKSQQALQDEVAALSAELALTKAALTESESVAMAMAEASQFVGGKAQEQPTGKTVKVRICTNPHVHDTKKHKYIEVDRPTYYFAIDLPSGAGISLSTNGVEYYHGQTYEFDQDTLADMKSRVARCWDHEKSIHGDNENAYRRPTNIRVG